MPNKVNCYFYKIYQDMGAIIPICDSKTDYIEATNASCFNCKKYITRDEVNELVEKFILERNNINA